jgi:predicted nucleotidyltransferase
MQLDELRTYKPAILAIAEKHRAENVRVFGSVMRGNATVSSNVDFLVHLKPGALDLAALYRELTELLGHEVDVVPDDSEIYYPAILQEAIPL